MKNPAEPMFCGVFRGCWQPAGSERLAHDVGAASDEDHVLGRGELAGPGHGAPDVGHGFALQAVDGGLRGQLLGRQRPLGVRLREEVVRLAGQQGQQFAVEKGLQAGEQVITDGAQRLREGAAVQVLN